MADFQYLKRLGEGQFGEVWHVLDKALNVERAIKLVRPDRIHDPSDFYREPQTLTQLNHENIVQVHEAGTLEDGRLYIAMEYLPNGSLEDLFAGAPAPIAESLLISFDACRGVEYAHNKNYLHRDIKPANILLTSRHKAKLSDFGLATRADSGGVASPYGYLAHLAPEVIEAGLTSVATDVYALAVTLYRLVNGDEYLPDPSLKGIEPEDAIVAGTFPNRKKFRAHVPDSVRRVIRAAMDVNPAKRTSSAAALRHRLEQVMPKVSFIEGRTTGIAEWQGASRTHDWLVSIDEQQGVFNVAVSRSKRGGQISRRSIPDCREFGTKAAALKHARVVLNRIATQGK